MGATQDSENPPVPLKLAKEERTAPSCLPPCEPTAQLLTHDGQVLWAQACGDRLLHQGDLVPSAGGDPEKQRPRAQVASGKEVKSGKESFCQCRGLKRRGLDPWVGKIPWSRNWQPTPVFLPGKSHGKRSLAGYSP